MVVVEEVVGAIVVVVVRIVMQLGPVKPAAQTQTGTVPAIKQTPPK
jgi:hypothetical protein